MSIALSFVAFESEPALTLEALCADFASRWPDLPAPAQAGAQDNTLSFKVGDHDVIVGLMPAPYPWSDLEGPCATTILWPEAATVLKAHRTHAIVTVRSDELDAIERSTLLTRATASVLAASSTAVGVYWSDATLVVPKALFLDFATEILPHGLPVPIWVDFRVGRDSDTTSAGFTSGMAALGHMELETRNATETPGELRERLTILVEYLLEHGPVIRDGDTVGGDENERIQVVYAESSFGHEGQVMRLEYA